MLLRASQIVGSTYHCVRITDGLRKAGEEERRITAVATWQDAPYFTDAERVVLELAEAVLTPNPFAERVSDELFARVSRHYDDEAIWHLTMALGHLSLFIPVALIGKPVPGRPPGKNYTHHCRSAASTRSWTMKWSCTSSIDSVHSPSASSTEAATIRASATSSGW
ncbi:carboxymuconolactone decarboxylase family protein [Streptomyces sp. NPDC007917]